jgi:outer membrane protein
MGRYPYRSSVLRFAKICYRVLRRIPRVIPSPDMHSKVLIVAALMVGAGQSRAETRQEPLWEFGLGIGATAFQDYPGSDTTRLYPIPVPYFVYNGEFLRADKSGVRGLLINQDWLELNISGDINAVVPHDTARYGMPELRPTIELGPAVYFHIIKRDSGRLKLDLQVPVRAAFTIASSPQSIGWISDPRLVLKIKDTFGMHGWNTEFGSGPMFIDKKYSDYYYSVAPQYATANRPAYTAPGGYSGTQFGITVTKRFSRTWFAAYIHYDTLRGAVFQDSPLVERAYDWSAGFGFAWILGRSTRVVEVSN